MRSRSDRVNFLNEIHPHYKGKKLPLSRFLHHLTKRYHQYAHFHLQSEDNRLSFLLRLLDEMPRDRMVENFPINKEAIDYLNEVVPMPRPMTRFMYKILQGENFRFDISNDVDYGKFLFFYVDHCRNYFRYPDRLFPDFIFEHLNQRSMRNETQAYPISIYMDELWQQRESLHRDFDISTISGRIAFSVYFCLHIKIKIRTDNIMNKLIPGFLYELLSKELNDGRSLLAHSLNHIIGDNSQVAIVIDKLGLHLTTNIDNMTLRSLMPKSVADANSTTNSINIVGPYRSKSGLGYNVLMSKKAFELSSINYNLVDFTLNDSTANKSTKVNPQQNSSISLLHIQPDNLPEYIAYSSSTLRQDEARKEYLIGFFAWESDVQPDAHLLGIDLIDEIWVPSVYVKQSFETVTNKPIIVMPHTVELPDVDKMERAYFGLQDSDYIFHFSLDLHSWIDRKNPNGAVEAFVNAFPHERDVKLVIKARNGYNYKFISSNPLGKWESILDSARSDDRIIIINDELSFSDTVGLIKCCDVYLSLHRSEGFGYTAAEAMYLAKPTIVTDYSGSQEFTSNKTNLLVDASERYIQPGEYIFYKGGQRWSEPNVLTAARHMKWCYDNRDQAKLIGELAREHIVKNFSLERMSQRYKIRFSEIVSVMQYNSGESPSIAAQ